MVVIGVGITVFLLMFFSTIVDKEKHKHIRTFFLLVSLPLLFLIPASLSLDKEVCEVVLNDTQEVYIYGNNFTDYHWASCEGASEAPLQTDRQAFLFHKNITNNYTEYCYVKEDGSRTFIRAFSIILVIFMIYIAFIFFADIISWLTSIIKKV